MRKSLRIADIPDDALPSIDDLNGDLRIMAGLVGVRQALVIAEAFDGTPIRCYGIKKLKGRWRNSAIRQMADNGVSVIRLARMYDLCDRQIKNILGTVDEETDGRQLRLF